MLMLHKLKYGEDDMCSIRTSDESHIYWRKHSHRNPLYFRKYADFEADNESDTSSVGNKTTNVYKQNPKLNGYKIVSELDDVSENGYRESLVGYNIVDWHVNK